MIANALAGSVLQPGLAGFEEWLVAGLLGQRFISNSKLLTMQNVADVDEEWNHDVHRCNGLM